MGKTISVKLPDEDAERLEKISADRQESVSESVRNLIRSAGEKRGGDGEEMRPGPDTKLEEILTILRSIEASKPVQNPDSETAKKIEKIGAQIQKIQDEIGKIPKSEGIGTGGGIDPKTITKIDISGLEKSVMEISLALTDNEKKAKNIWGYLGQVEEKAENILGGMSWKISLILGVIGAGFVAGGYALALYVMPDIPALEKKESALKESIRVLSLQDPEKLDMATCDGKPCVRIIPGQSYGNDPNAPFYPIAPIK